MTSIAEYERSLKKRLDVQITAWQSCEEDPQIAVVAEYYRAILNGVHMPDADAEKNARIDSSLGLLEIEVPREDQQ